MNIVGQDSRKRIVVAAAEEMRREIGNAGGREVFFAGSLNGKGLVERVRVCARGHEGAVPAFFEAVRTGEVVLHNHPTGGIDPSDADLELASLFGRHGHGVYIVDNEVRRVYAVVEPLLHEAVHKLDPEELSSAFDPQGRIAEALPEFEVRPQQVEMMEVVARAFNHDGVAVVEAPTGVGKTLAYLLPAVLWATRNRERVVISTRTINLQEQIMFKDIPLLAQCLDQPFYAVLVKGRGNYLCRRRLSQALSETALFDDKADREELDAISEWARKTKDGSLSDLPFVPGKTAWERVCSEADACLGSACPVSTQCFVIKARREVAKADLLVVNHHMLFSDLAIKREMGQFASLAVLPAYRRVILDEAHNVEDSATEYFGAEVTRNGALALLGRFVRSERGRERGLLPFLKVKLIQQVDGGPPEALDDVLDVIDNMLFPAIGAARESLVAAFGALRSFTAERCGQIGREIRWRLTETVLEDDATREIHTKYVLPAVEEVRTCAVGCGRLLEALARLHFPGNSDESPVLTEITQLRAYQGRLERLANTLAEGTSETLAPNTVRWTEIDAKKNTIVRVARCPLEVAEPMAEWVYSNLNTVVMTSATLTVDQGFDFLFTRLGLNLIRDTRVESVALDSPFDFKKQALLCIPTEIASPDDPVFLDETVTWIRRTLGITRGHAFVLFTSFYALDYAFSRLSAELEEAGITPLKQGMASRTHLLDRFRADASSVLFATDSFWEGVDVAGDALQCVILPKLPFRVPTEPILEARAEAVDASGGNSFMEYIVPQAVIRFRQGLGRLIRRKSDRGSILVLDRRIMTKRYGKAFRNSLPPIRTVAGKRENVFGVLSKFFGRNDGKGTES